MKKLLRIGCFFIALFQIGSSACSDSGDPLMDIAGVWNHLETINKLHNEWANNEEAQPRRLICNGFYYSGWPNNSLKVDITNSRYLAVLDTYIGITKIYYDGDVIIMKVSYQVNNTTIKKTATMKIHFISPDEIWFEPEYTDSNFLDSLNVNDFEYGSIHRYIRAPLWVN